MPSDELSQPPAFQDIVHRSSPSFLFLGRLVTPSRRLCSGQGSLGLTKLLALLSSVPTRVVLNSKCMEGSFTHNT